MLHLTFGSSSRLQPWTGFEAKGDSTSNTKTKMRDKISERMHLYEYVSRLPFPTFFSKLREEKTKVIFVVPHRATKVVEIIIWNENRTRMKTLWRAVFTDLAVFLLEELFV